MPKKTAKPRKTSKKKTDVEDQLPDAEGVFMSKMDMLQLEVSQQRAEISKLKATEAALRWELTQLKQKQARTTEQTQLAQHQTATIQLHAKLVGDLGSKYSVDLNQCALDPETGRLTPIPTAQ